MATTTKAKRQAAMAKSSKRKVPKANPVAMADIAKPAKPARKAKAQEPVVEDRADAATTIKRYALDDFVASGKATIGGVIEQFGLGLGGLRTIARQCRYGRYQVVGIKREDNPAGGDSRPLAAKLAKLKPATKITQLVAPPRRK